MKHNGDTFRRRLVDKDLYQCGCRWERQPKYGDVLIECPIHYQAGLARFRKFEREMREKQDKI